MKRDLDRMKEKYELEASLIGLKYIGAASKDLPNGYRRYKHLSCDHYEDLLPANVRKAEVTCKVCIDEKYKKEAEKEGLKLNRRIKSGLYDYNLPCGHSQQIYVSAVRTGEWICRLCHKSYFEKPSEIYLLRLQNENFVWLKLGYTNNLKIRIKNYKLLENTKIEVIKKVLVPTAKIAIEIEQKIHSDYFKTRLDPVKMKKHHRQDGYSECYPETMLQCLLDSLKLVERTVT